MDVPILGDGTWVKKQHLVIIAQALGAAYQVALAEDAKVSAQHLTEEPLRSPLTIGLQRAGQLITDYVEGTVPSEEASA